MKYTKEHLESIFSISENSPSGLVWKISPKMGKGEGYTEHHGK